MVRTVATAVRASGGKSSKASKTSTTPKTFNTSSSNERNTIGGNPVCPRETPTWQKPITSFFIKSVELSHDAHTSKNKPEQTNTDERIMDMEVLGEGCSTMNIEENSDEFLNKENAQSNNLEDKYDNKNNTLNEIKKNDDENKISTKKQKLDFYKHLEEIEQI